ncbi:MAG: amidohydrolase family protein, partial [Gemmatimonadetes bacterium]|nr:amidohydrolase [Gemmatimonadota bacterium]NIR77676.1 amidohydrolase [Gemmatimonadota bacterium]NIT86218.1 amidohydrolase [Gemmatimonadota bacterium]NIU30043.1 amidohydrolase [Gemmatimonadota bacterium]NIU35002.1 amidohydrolase family protein [Gemmatimonadota bacterium]
MRPSQRRTLPLVVFLLLCGVVSACTSPGPGQADRVFVNARVLTMDAARPRASAVAVRGEEVVAVGDDADVARWVGAGTRIVDLEGRTVIPGINETHIHVRDLGFERNTAVNLTPARNVGEIQEMLAGRLEQLRTEDRLCCWSYPTTGGEGPWLFGLGWTQDRLEGSRMADRRDLDEVSREVPISLDRIYRGVAVNTRVFELLGYEFDDPSTWPDWFRRDPPDFGPGEIILRDSEGLPTGVFLGERAPRLVSAAIPEKSLDRKVDSLLGGMEYLASLGITALVEAGSRMGEVTRVYQEAYDRRGGRLPVRAVVYDGWYRSGDPQGIGDPAAIRERARALGFHAMGDRFLRVRGAKSSMDGGMGSRSAAVSEPYVAVPEDPLGAGNRGALREPSFERALAQYRALADYGWEIHTHAIGDRAIDRVVDLYRVLLDSLRAGEPDRERRWSIIHLYQPDEPDRSVVEEMSELGIVAAINPANLYYEGESFLRNVGPERMARHTPYRTLRDAGVRMACGSDYPNNPPDPWVGIYQMTTRRIQRHDRVYGEDETVPLAAALRCFTINGAYLTYDEDARGSIAPGKLADLVLLDGDLEAATPDDILEMADRVLLTLVG